MRYIDPSGHFTDDALIAYLKQQWGDKYWEAMWKQWSTDKNWMNLMHAANGGDVLSMIDKDNDPHYYQFEGEGDTKFTGVTQVGDVVGSDLNSTRIPILPEDLKRKNLGWNDLAGSALWRMKDGHLTHVAQLDERGYSTGSTITGEQVKQSAGVTGVVVTLGSWLLPFGKAINGIISIVMAYDSSANSGDWQKHYGIIEGNDQFVMGRYGVYQPIVGTYSGNTGELKIRK